MRHQSLAQHLRLKYRPWDIHLRQARYTSGLRLKYLLPLEVAGTNQERQNLFLGQSGAGYVHLVFVLGFGA